MKVGRISEEMESNALLVQVSSCVTIQDGSSGTSPDYEHLGKEDEFVINNSFEEESRRLTQKSDDNTLQSNNNLKRAIIVVSVSHGISYREWSDHVGNTCPSWDGRTWNVGNRVESEDWQLYPVLPDEVSMVLPNVRVHVDLVVDRKYISRLVKQLSSLSPIRALLHLKRVRNDGAIILDLARGHSQTECIQHLKTQGLDVTGLRCEPEVLEVPAVPAITRKQFDDSRLLWPCNFHEDRYLESVLAGTLFGPKQRANLEKYMSLCVEVARERNAPAAAVVVDPRTGEVIAVAFDERDSHPMKHAIMVVMDLVANGQGGGAWDHSASQWFCRREHLSRRNNCNITEIDSMQNTPVPYLCTGCDVFVTREPCMMCAMALVHSRVRRVFYGCPSPKGGLGTLAKIHALPSLNHNFEVFRGVLEGACRNLT